MNFVGVSGIISIMKIILNTDGGSRGNPGPAGVGAILSDGAGKVLREGYKFVGVVTNNEAEYRGLLLGLELARKFIVEENIAGATLEVRMDSELVIKQLRGEYRVKDKNLAGLFGEVREICSANFPNLEFVHVLREKNQRADELANRAMDEAVKF